MTGWWWTVSKKRSRKKNSLEEEFLFRAYKSVHKGQRKAEKIAKKIAKKAYTSVEKGQRYAKRIAMKACRHQMHYDPSAKACLGSCTLCGYKEIQHEFFPHPTELYRISCLHCNQQAACNRHESEDNKVLRYLSSRRKLRLVENLYSLSVAIAPASFYTVRNAMSQSRVTSNTGILHITLLEGSVTASDSYLHQVASVLHREPTCTVVGIHTIATVDPDFRLVLANIELPAWTRFSQWTSTTDCRFPQWPLHAALGTVHASDGESSLRKLREDLVGQILYTSPDRLTWLAPRHGRAHHSSWSLHARAPSKEELEIPRVSSHADEG